MSKELITKNQSNWLTISRQSLHKYPDILLQIYQEKIPGMLIKQVFSSEEIKKVCQKIESQNNLHSTVFGNTIGLSLSQKVTSESDYFQEADKFRKYLKQLFNTDFEATIESIVGQISGGKKVEIPQENKAYYTPSTIRVVYPESGGIPPHTGSEFLYNPGYDYFRTKADIADSLSYFVMLDKAEKGGELVLYDLLLTQADKNRKELKQFFIEIKQNLEQLPQISIDPDVGDMVIFKGSTIMHKVADIFGRKKRITIGGFLAISYDRQNVYYWS